MSLLVSPGPINEPIAGLSLTSQEALERFAIRRQAFFAAGIAAGDRVFIGHGNSIAFFLDLLAVWASGACAVPLDGKLTTFECRNLIAAARPRFFIGTAANEALFHDVLEESGVMVNHLVRLRRIAGVWLFFALINIWNTPVPAAEFERRSAFFFSLFGIDL